jgi:hypothetical protein
MKRVGGFADLEVGRYIFDAAIFFCSMTMP